MRLVNAAIGLAAVGAGILVARMVLGRKGGAAGEGVSPPDPAALIGYPRSRKSAAESAEILRGSPSDRPM